MVLRPSLCVLSLFTFALCASAQQPAEAPKLDASKLPHVSIDVKAKQVRVECEALHPEMPLEFFVCMSGTAEHEAVLRSSARPSHVHLGLLMLGLQPGEPVHYSKAADKWLPPHGPPLHIFAEWEKDGKKVNVPAYRLMRNVKSKKEMPATTWIFAGSRVMEDGKYAADGTGYLVSVVNFDLTVIDIPELASNANESLEWEINPDTVPAKGTKVWMVIEAAGKENGAKAGNAAEKKVDATGADVFNGGENPAATAPKPAGQPGERISDVTVDDAKIKALRQRWDQIVLPRNKALREAAQAHYEVLNALRKEQNRLIDEADRIQRVIDQVQKEYQDMTTPRPDNEEAPKTEK